MTPIDTLHTLHLSTIDIPGDDPWGESAISMHFALADTLARAGHPVPDGWQYRPGAVTGQPEAALLADDFLGTEIAALVAAGEVDLIDLIQYGDLIIMVRGILNLTA